MGKPARRRPLDLQHRRHMARCARLLRQPAQRCSCSIRLRNPFARRSRILGNDARLHGFRQSPEHTCSVPHMAKHQHRQGCCRAVGTLRLQHSVALEHLAPLPMHPQRRGARGQHRFHHHPCRICALAAHRPEGTRHRRCIGSAPHRPCHTQLRRYNGG